MKQVFSKIKSDPVLMAAWILAIISAFVVVPGKEYIGYIDFRSLGILWSLMIVIQGLKENSFFEKIATRLLEKVKTGRSLAIILIMMCFLGSMLITNDVALITFIPFALMLLHSCKRDDLAIPVVVLQTVAANLGSMLTPIGNPQNLYLFSATGMGLVDFILCMLPYTLLTLGLLFISALLLRDGKREMEMSGEVFTVENFGSRRQIIIYMVLFVMAILSVVRVIPWYVAAICIFVIVLGMDYKILFRADYMLLMTFIGFFIFTGNIGRIPQIHDYLKGIVSGREFLSAIVASQFISNVPATFLLFEFAEDYKELLRGVNIGGLGTLIASMASLISYKSFANAFPDKKGKYILHFSVVNVIYLLILVLLHVILV